MFSRARVLIFVFWFFMASCSDPLQVRLFTDGRAERESLQKVRRVDLVYKDPRGQTLLKESRIVEQGIENSIEWRSKRLEEMELEERGRFLAQGYTAENKMTFLGEEVVQNQNKGILALELRSTTESGVAGIENEDFEKPALASLQEQRGVEIFFEPQVVRGNPNQCLGKSIFLSQCTFGARAKVVLKNSSIEELKVIVRIWGSSDHELLFSDLGLILQPRELYPLALFVREYSLMPEQAVEFYYYGQIEKKTRENYFELDRLNWTVDSFDQKEQRRQIRGDLLL